MNNLQQQRFWVNNSEVIEFFKNNPKATVNQCADHLGWNQSRVSLALRDAKRFNYVTCIPDGQCRLYKLNKGTVGVYNKFVSFAKVA